MAKKLLNGELNLKDQQLTCIPSSLHNKRNQFNNLVRLNLSNNMITELDDDVCRGLNSLQELNLQFNKLKVISKHVKALMQLKKLNLD